MIPDVIRCNHGKARYQRRGGQRSSIRRKTCQKGLVIIKPSKCKKSLSGTYASGLRNLRKVWGSIVICGCEKPFGETRGIHSNAYSLAEKTKAKCDTRMNAKMGHCIEQMQSQIATNTS